MHVLWFYACSLVLCMFFGFMHVLGCMFLFLCMLYILYYYIYTIYIYDSYTYKKW